MATGARNKERCQETAYLAVSEFVGGFHRYESVVAGHESHLYSWA